jgi:hypothetical protein
MSLLSLPHLSPVTSPVSCWWQLPDREQSAQVVKHCPPQKNATGESVAQPATEVGDWRAPLQVGLIRSKWQWQFCRATSVHHKHLPGDKGR